MVDNTKSETEPRYTAQQVAEAMIRAANEMEGNGWWTCDRCLKKHPCTDDDCIVQLVPMLEALLGANTAENAQEVGDS